MCREFSNCILENCLNSLKWYNAGASGLAVRWWWLLYQAMVLRWLPLGNYFQVMATIWWLSGDGHKLWYLWYLCHYIPNIIKNAKNIFRDFYQCPKTFLWFELYALQTPPSYLSPCCRRWNSLFKPNLSYIFCYSKKNWAAPWPPSPFRAMPKFKLFFLIELPLDIRMRPAAFQ